MEAEGVDRIGAITALLERTMEAHGRYEETALHGVYDREWARWYAAHAVEQGIGVLIGHTITADQLAQFLAGSNAEFERIDPRPSEPWAAYTAQRIAQEL